MMKLLAELKRRQMFRVAAAYAVVAWLLLQIVNNLAPGLNLPNWALTLVIVMLAIGFPIALVFAWIHQLAPADAAAPKAATTKLDYVLAGGLILVIGLVSYQQLAPSGDAGRTGPANDAPQSSAARTAGISIAVLPFANLSGDAAQEFFSDGMTEEITAALARVQGLTVLGRTSAFQFKGQKRDLREIGQTLGATHLIEGAVRKEGDRVRITAQLVQAQNGANVWSQSYDRQLTSVFATQEDIARAIAGALRVPLGLQSGETLVRSSTMGQASYEDYLRAKGLVRARGGERLTEATRVLETVIAREPDFAPAHALLAYTYNLILVNENAAASSGEIEQGLPLIEELRPKAQAAAQRAIQIDPANSDGYIAFGYSDFLRGNFRTAADLFDRGMALDPVNPDGLHFYSVMLGELGYLSQAASMRERLSALEPLVPVFRIGTARILLARGQTDAALAIPEANVTRAMAYAQLGRYADAADVLSTVPADSFVTGRLEQAMRLLRSAPSPVASPQSLPRLGSLNFVYLHIGARDRVLEFYENSIRFGVYGGTQRVAFWGPSYAIVRKTERFRAYLRNAGMLDYWRVRGWPDLCRPVGADDFVCD